MTPTTLAPVSGWQVAARLPRTACVVNPVARSTPAPALPLRKSSVAAAQAPRWQHSYTYSDGLGREVMKKVLAKPGDAHFVDGNGQLRTRKADPRWIGTGRIVLDNAGAVDQR